MAMVAVIECVMLFFALLGEVWLGSYGFAPCFTVFVLFHASRTLSLRFAVPAALVVGTVTDLLYGRPEAVTPFWYVLALYAGHAAMFRRENDASGRALQIALAGAAVGAVTTLRWMWSAGYVRSWGWIGVALDLFAGAFGGVLKLALTVLILDFLCTYMGAGGFFPPVRGAADKPRRPRRVRAEKVAGRRS